MTDIWVNHRRHRTWNSVDRLRLFAAILVVFNALATAVAVALNLPTQFGGRGTDAGQEFLTVGTAISAPPAPVLLLLLVVALAGRSGRGRWVGIGAAFLAAAAVGIGGVGEILAEPTAQSPAAVLVGAGVAWLIIAAVLLVLATAATGLRRGGPLLPSMQ